MLLSARFPAGILPAFLAMAAVFLAVAEVEGAPVRGEYATVTSLEDNTRLASEVLRYYEDSVEYFDRYFGREAGAGADITVTVSFEKLKEAGRFESTVDPGIRAFVYPVSKKMFVYLDRTTEDVMNPLRATVKHETFHIYLADFESRGKSRFPDWFNEGAAQYFSLSGPFLSEMGNRRRSGKIPADVIKHKNRFVVTIV